MDSSYKKNNGIFGTPIEISEYLISRISFPENARILEPGIGTGSIVDSILRKIPDSSQLYAFDREKEFVEASIIKHGLSKDKIFCVDFFTNTPFDNVKFNLIIGNPPYGAVLSKENLDYVKSHTDIFPQISKESSVLFIYKAIQMLAEGGELYFILPATITRVLSYKCIRDYIKKTCYVKSIYNLGQKFNGVGYELIILHIMKKGSFVIEPECVVLYDLISGREVLHSLSYKEFLNQDIFPLFINDDDAKLLSRIEADSFKLESIIEMPRGKSYDLINSIDYDSPDRVYTARNISKFSINESPIFVSREKPNEVALMPKILVQNLAYKIVAALDYRGIITNETVNNLTITDSNYKYEYILAILNSTLMTYYIQNKLTNRARLNIHMDKPYIGQIPIKIDGLKHQDEITSLVKKITNGPKNGADRDMLEKIIFNIYGVEENEIEGKYIYGKKNI